MVKDAEELKSIEQLKREMKEARKSLDENQKIQDAIAEEKHRITLARINRSHARREIERYEKQKEELKELLSQYDPQSVNYKTAIEKINDCQKYQDICVTAIKENTQDINDSKDLIKRYNKAIDEFEETTRAFIKENKELIKEQQRAGINQTIEETKDMLVSLPGDIKKTSEELADNATATLSELTDAMYDSMHEAKDKGLVAFDKLAQKVPSIMRAHTNRVIEVYEKDLAKTEKFVKFVDKFEEITAKKKEQMKEVGKGLKTLFTDWGNKPKEQDGQNKDSKDEKDPKDKNELVKTVASQSEHKKPGFLRWMANKMVKYDAEKLEKAYKKQIKSYQKTIEHNVVRSTEVIGHKFQRMEDRLNEVNMKSQDQIDNITIKQNELKVKTDELIK